jgi:4-oxalmesaconate hydratase
MIIDSHAHFTTEPKAMPDFRAAQVAAFKAGSNAPLRSSVKIGDDELRACILGGQLKFQRPRGIDLTIFSPRASAMGHHVTDFKLNLEWTQLSNEMVHRICTLFPGEFVGVAQLPQVAGQPPEIVIPELERCVNEFGFIGCNLNPDPSGGFFNSPPLSDKHWYPLYEKLCELDIPAMIHVSGSCNPAYHTTGSYYLCADTMAFMQLLMSDLFKEFPSLKMIVPHGGGAVPYHWGRFRGLAIMNDRPPLPELMRNNVFFDTCVYHQPGIDLLFKLVPIDNILFASELIGAVKGIDPETGLEFDDTRRYVENAGLSAEAKQKVYEDNARRVYPRLARAKALAR